MFAAHDGDEASGQREFEALMSELQHQLLVGLAVFLWPTRVHITRVTRSPSHTSSLNSVILMRMSRSPRSRL